jgi:hypothetical protein
MNGIDQEVARTLRVGDVVEDSNGNPAVVLQILADGDRVYRIVISRRWVATGAASAVLPHTSAR